MARISASHEDYLEAIVELGGTPTHEVRSVDVAAQLGVSKASVSKAVRALDGEGMVAQAYYGGIALTQAGYDVGCAVLRRHRALRTFLTDVLGVPEEVADEEACLIEHDISEDTASRWIAFVEDRTE